MVTHKPGCTIMCLHVSLLASKYCQWAHLSSIPLYVVKRISTELPSGDNTEADNASSYTSIDTHPVVSIFRSTLFELLGTLNLSQAKQPSAVMPSAVTAQKGGMLA